MATKLSSDDINSQLADLPGWELKAEKLHRSFKFADFKQAFAFMTQVALRAEQMKHHPEWFNVYSTVRVDLTTHDCAGISALDFELATYMNQIADQWS